MDKTKIIKTLLLLAAIIVLCTFLARHTMQGETLTEYAENHPELAYATPEKAIESAGPTPSPTPTPMPTPTPIQRSAENSFYYEPLSDELIAQITGVSYPMSHSEAVLFSRRIVNILPDDELPAVSYEELRYLNVLYYDFEGNIQEGELICNLTIAEDLKEIFYQLYENQYPIEKIKLIDEYDGDDTLSMLDNNTSCFNYRVVDGSTSLSKHALGCAIDINPYYNPYVVFNKNGSGQTYISPEGSEKYADRSQDFPYKIDENDLCYQLFKKHGFTWGGDWRTCKDYQHFQKIPDDPS